MSQETTANGYQNACCSQVSKQFAQVNLPVRIEPRAVLGCPTMQCIGQPSSQCECGENGFDITISQYVSICLPIEYSLSTKTNQPYMCCKDLCE